jgi:hypothetical protein
MKKMPRLKANGDILQSQQQPSPSIKYTPHFSVNLWIRICANVMGWPPAVVIVVRYVDYMSYNDVNSPRGDHSILPSSRAWTRPGAQYDLSLEYRALTPLQTWRATRCCRQTVAFDLTYSLRPSSDLWWLDPIESSGGAHCHYPTKSRD